jgi:short-subunit dehydrogenase
MPEASRAMIVTGASSGIGRALALAAARAGYSVAIAARRGARLDEVAQTIRDAEGQCITIIGDITAREMPTRIVEAARREFGRIDVVVNNAGTGAYGPLLEQSDAAIEAQWQLHVASPLRLTRAAIADLEKTRGQVIFIGSGVARVPLPSWGAYSLAKAAIRAAAIQLRRELRPRGIAVTYVDPGVVRSEFHSTVGIAPTMKALATPERLARAILRGIARRAAVVNGVPWQTFFTALGEFSGTLADPVVIGAFTARRTPHASATEASPKTCHPEPVEGVPEPAAGFEKALEPVTRRMERVKLPAAFLRQALSPGATLELGSLAMQWAGMPNKNERAALREALDALAANGYLEQTGEETWSVLHAAD